MLINALKINNLDYDEAIVSRVICKFPLESENVISNSFILRCEVVNLNDVSLVCYIRCHQIFATQTFTFKIRKKFS